MAKLKHQELGIPSTLYQPLGAADVKKVAEAAFQVLEKSGMAVHTDTGRAALKKAGAVVDDATKTVKFPRSLVEDGLAARELSHVKAMGLAWR